MIVRTCLLISEDPDDHVEFSEALYEIANDIVLITVSDAGKAMDLLMLKRCIPDFIILSGGIGSEEADRFFDVLESDPLLRDIMVIAYGEWELLDLPRVGARIGIDLSFSELKDALRRAIERKGRGNAAEE